MFCYCVDKRKEYGTIKETPHLIHSSNGVYHILLQAETTVTIKLSSPNSMWGDIFYECLDEIKESNVPAMDSIECCSEHTLDIVDKLIFKYNQC